MRFTRVAQVLVALAGAAAVAAQTPPLKPDIPSAFTQAGPGI